MSEISHRSLELKTKVGRRHYFFSCHIVKQLGLSCYGDYSYFSVQCNTLVRENNSGYLQTAYTDRSSVLFFLQLTSAVKCFCLDQMSCLDCFLKILQTQQLIITNDILVLWYDPLFTLIDFEKSELFRTLYGLLLSRSLI